MAELRFGAGINEESRTDISPLECIAGRNFLLDPYSGAMRPRGPMDLAGSAPVESNVVGVMQLIKRDDTETTLVATETTIWKWGSPMTSVATITTGGRLRGTVWPIDDVLVMVDRNKVNTVMEWDGSAVSVMTHTITGVTDLYAAYAVVHNDRLWLLNVRTDSTSLPHVILASTFDDYDNFNISPSTASDGGGSRDGARTGNESFWITSPDLKEICGAESFAGELIISTKEGKIFKLTGSDAADYSFVEFYPKSHAIGTDSLVSIGTDVMYMKAGGRIELLSSAETFGDLEADDVGRFIFTTTAGEADPICVYDQGNQKVFVFLTDKAMVYDKTFAAVHPQLSPWSRYETLIDTGINTNAAAYIREPGGTAWNVYWGDSEGNVYNFHGTGTGDNGENIDASRTTRHITELDTINAFIAGTIEYRRRGECTLNLYLDWSGEYALKSCEIPLRGPDDDRDIAWFWGGTAYWGGDYYWGGGTFSEEQMTYASFSLAGKGRGFFLTSTISSTVDFFVNRLIV